ncbi:cell division protein FtsB [Lysobacter sp. BMK333-48F3]|nr:cell division protein FtsB [Lysobacter sp. BMK333-48F3]MBX9402233.1 cell division protein FtsB [Lysobacter sp. BMK333-48F3]
MRWVRVSVVALLALLALLQYRLWWAGDGRGGSVAALQAQVDGQSRENQGLQQRNAALAAEVEDLKSGEAAVEERARSELGMIKPGETFYRVVEAKPQAPGPNAAAAVSAVQGGAAPADSADSAEPSLEEQVDEPPGELPAPEPQPSPAQ